MATKYTIEVEKTDEEWEVHLVGDVKGWTDVYAVSPDLEKAMQTTVRDIAVIDCGPCEETITDNMLREVPCGSWFDGRKMFCGPCERRFEILYPQGWSAYPGDVCRHGKYVGGSGIDWICGPCEMGDD